MGLGRLAIGNIETVFGNRPVSKAGAREDHPPARAVFQDELHFVGADAVGLGELLDLAIALGEVFGRDQFTPA
jgi:hypothetical protein